MTDLGETHPPHTPATPADLPPYDPYAEWAAPTVYGQAPASPEAPVALQPAGPQRAFVPQATAPAPTFVPPPAAPAPTYVPTASPAAPDVATVPPVPVYALATFAQRGRALTIDTLWVLIPTAILCAFLLPSVIAHARADPQLVQQLSVANLTSPHPESGRIAHWLIVGSIRTTIAWWISLAVYSGYFMSRTNGQTPGRAAAGIRIVRGDGRPIDATWAVYRVVLVRGVAFSAVSLLTLGLATLARWGWSLWDDGQRTLDDVLTRSRVVVNPGAAPR